MVIHQKLARSFLGSAEIQSLQSFIRNASSAAKLKETCLYKFHVEKGAKMTNFAGFNMPVEYKAGIIGAHLHTRKNVSIFDVSHMLQTIICGKDRFEFIESLCVADAKSLQTNTGTLSVFTNENGGINDDLILSSADNFLYVVTNAGTREKDMAAMSKRLQEMKGKGKDVTLRFADDRGLLAVQGPKMVECVQPLTKIDLSKLPFMSSTVGTVAGIPDCRVTRCGYTGEDGCEISFPVAKARDLVDALLSSKGNPCMAGLGTRDTLRLEAGLCLYGKDINETTTPIEANLAWLIPKSRRERMDFPGAKTILAQLRTGPPRRRVGLVSTGPPIRAKAIISDASGKKIGEVTSGGPSPCLGHGTYISMGYVQTEHCDAGNKVQITVRNKPVEATITRLPFVPKYYFQ